MARSLVHAGIFKGSALVRPACDINRTASRQFMTLGVVIMTLEVVNCFLKIGRVAHHQCHILEIRTMTHRPLRYDTFSTVAMVKDRVAHRYKPQRYDLSWCVGTKKVSKVLPLGDPVSGSRSASRQVIRVVAHPNRPGLPSKADRSRSGSGQMVLRSTIPSSINRAKTKMSGEAVTHV